MAKNPKLKYDSKVGVSKSSRKGTAPVSPPAKISEVISKIWTSLCQTVLFVDIRKRLCVYVSLLFGVSLIADHFANIPKTYFAYKGHPVNQYFVKLSWGWTSVLTGCFIYLTASIYCCGKRALIAKHLCRIFVGTLVWFVTTHLFLKFEMYTSKCVFKEDSPGDVFSIESAKRCSSQGGKWVAFDVSGHAFLLIWCVLFIIEEAKVIIGWDGIKYAILMEDHKRKLKLTDKGSDESIKETYLRFLNDNDFRYLRSNYEKYDRAVKLNLLVLILLVLISDVMIVSTCLYFHTMQEKVIGGGTAIIIWYLLYYLIYPFWRLCPGEGLYKYSGKTRRDYFQAPRLSKTPRSKP